MMKTLASILLVLTIVYQCHCFRFLSFKPDLDFELDAISYKPDLDFEEGPVTNLLEKFQDKEQEVRALEKLPFSTLEANSQNIVKDFDLSGSLEKGLESREELMDVESEISDIDMDLLKQVELQPLENKEELSQSRGRPGIVGYCHPNSEWSLWHNRDRPSGTGDWEVKNLYLPKGTCADKNPTGIEARLVSTNPALHHKPYYYGGNVLSISVTTGLVCQNKNQRKGGCKDYEIRFCCKPADYNDGIVGSCPKDAEWTPWHSRDLPSGTGDWEVRSLYKPKGTCADEKNGPLAIQAKLVSTNQPYQYGNDVVTISTSTGFICRIKDQKDRRCNDYKVRYCCKKEVNYNDGIVGSCPRDGEWTPWHSRDLPSGTGDWEVRSLYKPKGTCADDKIAPLAIQAKLVSTNQPYQYGNDVVTVTPALGLICKKNNQMDGRCNDYKVRYCCKKKEETGIVGYCDLRTSSWTAWHDRDDPTVTGDWEVRDHYRPSGTCADLKTPPTAIQGRLVKSKLPWTSSGEVLSVDPDDGLICENRNQVDKFCEDYEVRYCCKRQIKPVCPGQLVFQACGSSCPKKCFAREYPFCTMQCVPECQCPRGLYQTSDNRCVARDQCYAVMKPLGREEFGYIRNEIENVEEDKKPT